MKMLINANLSAQIFLNLISSIINKMVPERTERTEEIRLKKDRLRRLVAVAKSVIAQKNIPDSVSQDVAAAEAVRREQYDTENANCDAYNIKIGHRFSLVGIHQSK